MNKKMFLGGLLAWLGILALGAWWSAGPYRWAEQHPEADAETTARTFPVHVAGLPNSFLRTHAERVDEEILDLPPDFEARDWGWRESRNRLAIFVALWTIAGFFVRWIVGRVLRGLKESPE